VVWPLLGAGCHLTRATGDAIAAAGFTIETARHFRFPNERTRNPSRQHVIGIARKPAAG
jgi:hypothetical protein